MMVAVLMLAFLVAGFGEAERAASAGLRGERPAPLAATTLKVCNSGCGTYDYTTISAAVSHASSGDEIRVAQGIYNETVQVYNKSLTFLGGYSSSNWNVRDPTTYKTTINADTAAATVKLACADGYACAGILDGFTLTGGNNSGQGGGVFVTRYGATISNNRIYDNRAKYGGGISVGNATNVVIQDNVIYDNAAAEDGGAIRVDESSVSIIGNMIRSNDAKHGGGISVRTSTATIDDNTIKLNDAESGGGGMQFIMGSKGLISNNRLEDNKAGVDPGGGGIHFWRCSPQYGGAPQFVGNTVSGNTARNAGGGVNIEDSTPVLRENVITNNHAGDHGGGISIIVRSAPTIVGNVIADNTSSVRAGGIWSYDSAPFIRSNEIVDNQAPTSGGIYLLVGAGFEITNNIIARNKATQEGGGVLVETDSHGKIVNNTFVANNQGASGEAISIWSSASVRVANNILVDHTYGVLVREGASATIEYNDAWDNSIANYSGASGSAGHISCNPEFVNRAGGDYHLTSGSCVIDKGTRTGAPTSDFDGDPRPVDGDGNGNAAWDMGADEYFNPVWVTKDVNKQVLEPNEDVSFTIEYRNNSASTATGVVITDLLSGYLTNVNYSSTGPTVTPRGGPKYIWDVDDLAPWEEGTITITGEVSLSIPTPMAITNGVTFQMDGYGPFEDEVLMMVGGLKTYAPAVFHNYAQ